MRVQSRADGIMPRVGTLLIKVVQATSRARWLGGILRNIWNSEAHNEGTKPGSRYYAESADVA